MKHHQRFLVPPESSILARIPLLPAVEEGDAGGALAVDPLVAEGMWLSARDRDIPAVDGDDPGGRRAATARAYDRRARFRPTPRGVFVGVQVALLGEDADLKLGADHRARSNPSGPWLTAVADHALGLPGVLERLRFTTSNLVRRHGRRLYHEQQSVPDVDGPQRVSVRATAATTLVLATCRGVRATYPQIVEAIRDAWPTVPDDLVRVSVLELCRRGFLGTDILPDDLAADPLAHLLARLAPDCALRESLSAVRDHLHQADQHRPGDPTRTTSLIAARDRCDELDAQPGPICVDVAADAHIVLPTTLVDQAADAVSLLWCLSHANPVLHTYHSRFLDRYGWGRLVPLLDATDPVVGIGDVDLGFEAEPMPDWRARVLGALHSAALASGHVEIELDAATITALAGPERSSSPPPTAEVYARVFAATEQDLAHGWLSLAVYPGGSQEAGSTLGRFASLLPAAVSSRAESAPAGALVAEVVVRPRTPRLATVALPTGFAQRRIPIGVPARDGDLALEDLYLVSDGHQLHLRSCSHGRPVVPVLYSRIGPLYIPPEARLLQAMALGRSRPWFGWSWGPSAAAPFQPRVRYQRTVLAPARWRLSPALVEAAGEPRTWVATLEHWRATTFPAPPAVVVTESGDHDLPLDLGDERDRELLRRYVRRGVTSVIELPGGAQAVQAVVQGPAGRHVLEIVVPLASTTPSAAIQPTVIGPRRHGDGLHLPGGRWLSLAISSPPATQDEVLADLYELLTGMEQFFDRWFWLRYATERHGPHLRVRFQGDPARLGGELLPALSAWCSRLIADRRASALSVEPYDQEIERYGGPTAIQAAEEVFAADSQLVLATLATNASEGERLIVGALSAAVIVDRVADGIVEALDGRNLDRAGRQRAIALRPHTREAAVNDTAIIASTHPMWRTRQAALDTYREAVETARRTDCASSLIHMHCNRLLGDLDQERIVRALAADLLASRPR